MGGGLSVSNHGLRNVDPTQLRDADLAIMSSGAAALTASSIDIRDIGLKIEWDGKLLLVMWVVREPYTITRRGWLSMLVGSAIDRVPLRAWAPRMLTYWRLLSSTWDYDEVRAWVPSEDARAKRFADRLGFKYDAGPCMGILPDGRDGDIHLWRRDE